MAKMFITGSAQSPSTEEFKARIARLSAMPAHTASPANARKNRPAKPGFGKSFPQDTADAQEPSETDDTSEASAEGEGEGAENAEKDTD
ncbi:hypothetical protein SAMN04487843_12147 [Methylobacterium sp. ap11]|uniref:hypothetical protein n=1 Tax=Methylobacterium sp. ap11 TaxID=1761799 RepID=UPI0008B95310|nr:hypothetical protein [Methylobacterium sp. ap11]SEP44909.1 hypothetical protein SAMN04487843_12147 [Methylobacterium sp. ap11]